jgi:uncharacterized coiled-coil protein SlyX
MGQQMFKLKTIILLVALASCGLPLAAQAFRRSSEKESPGYNTAAGELALHSLSSGGVWNTAIGSWALLSDTSGACNAAVGSNAMHSNSTGTDNTAVGVQTLRDNTTGSRNTALGYLAGINLTTGSNNIDIANIGTADESSTIRIGSPAQTRTFIAGIREVTTANANAIPVLIDSYGQLGTTSSSRRFKKEIKPMDKASEAVLSLKPVTFQYKSDDKGTPQFGLIAEEVAEVNPDLVVRDEKGEVYTVRYDAVNAMLLNEFQKEHRKVEEQGKTIAELRSTIAQQGKAMAALATQVKEQNAKIEKVSVQIAMSRTAPELAENR